jgi:two-component system C4-dicarboxylate transport sensor histidine kinase DctB
MDSSSLHTKKDPSGAPHLQELHRFAGLGRLSASLIHEISNPLSAALLHLEDVRDQSGSMLQVRRNLLSLSRYIDAARQQVRLNGNKQSFCIKPQLDQVKRIVKPLARSAGVQLHIERPRHYHIYGDAVKFQQVMVNLIVNAVEAYQSVPDNDGLKTVYVSIAGTTRQAALTVKDYGQGISPEQIPRLFEAFYTTKYSAHKPGLGIGLAIVRQYVTDDFEGSVLVSSSRRHGTRFTVKLPARLIAGKTN